MVVAAFLWFTIENFIGRPKINVENQIRIFLVSTFALIFLYDTAAVCKQFGNVVFPYFT